MMRHYNIDLPGLKETAQLYLKSTRLEINIVSFYACAKSDTQNRRELVAIIIDRDIIVTAISIYYPLINALATNER